jgi:threonine/homoserine/homoserine lactone efflux protein
MITELIAGYGLFILAVISPGPDFAITVQNSVQNGSRAGYFTALGVAIANGLHVLYVSIGVGALITSSAVATLVLKYFAIAYLVYLGISCLRAKVSNLNYLETSFAGTDQAVINGARTAFTKGFLVNAFNPKAVFFWLSYFAYISSLGLQKGIYIPFVASLIALIFAWFSFVAFVMTRKKVRSAFLAREKLFNIVMGLILILLALKLALS